ncbi:alpha-1,6-mannosyl-glycoprotein 2-beta-N-acetylglucosaminyltransferase-like [Anticarsia gemmatalis]|uniref:alpha-1,6-mannosyl-glycoprotein 2-beta-N-acetylglucosaminyltransferase-like n=1 Tax=Anticarsia gemmatalis TaxID=129554 RepID=UPI003F77628D
MVPRHLRRYLKFSEGYKVPVPKLCPRELSALSTAVELLNYEREVFNLDRFGSVNHDTTMIVVQVHRDAERLQYLIVSLAQVHYIQSTVVIFSHSFFDERINNLILNITFCRVMQIFYPFSVQLYPNKFPGVDIEDCMHSETVVQYCSDRNAYRTEHKHHWWWKANFVFNRLDWSRGYKGTVIFLEEDNYVLPDLLYMLRFMTRSNIAGTSVMAFGRPFSKDLDYDILIVDIWRPPYDKGLALNKTIWKKITALSSFFCTYDDLSWSYSLLNVFKVFKAGHVDMVACLAPRVLSTALNPSGKDAFQNIYKHTKKAPFFPSTVKAALVFNSNGRVGSTFTFPHKGNGGWTDVRDQLLCLDPFSPAATDETVDYTTTTVNYTTFISLPALNFNYSAKVVIDADTNNSDSTSSSREHTLQRALQTLPTAH